MPSRRTILRTGAIAGLAGILGVASYFDPEPESVNTRVNTANWPLPHHDTHNTNHNPSATPPTNTPERAFMLQNVGKGPPAVVDDHLFVGGKQLTAHDAATGERRWQADSPPVDSIAVGPNADTVYAQSFQHPTNDSSTLAAYASSDGDQQWTHTSDAKAVGAPIVAGNLLLRSESNGLTAFTRADGTPRWQLTDTGFIPAPAVTSETFFHGVSKPDNALVRRSRDRGTLANLLGDPPDVKWRREHERQLTRSPVVATDTVLAGTTIAYTPAESKNDAVLVAYGLNGTEQWQHVVGSTTATPAVADGAVYLVAGWHTNTVSHEESKEVPERAVLDRRDAVVRSFELAGGAPRWERRFSNLGASPIAPVVANGAVFAGLFDWKTDRAGLVVLDKADGETLWRRELPATPVHLAVAGDRLYVTLSNGTLIAFS